MTSEPVYGRREGCIGGTTGGRDGGMYRREGWRDV